MKIAGDVTELIGGTPLVKIQRICCNCAGQLLAKLEYFNPMSSIKDRIAVSMIDTAISEGKIKTGTRVVESTSGNTGIGLAFVCAVRGIPLTITLPENFSEERKKILKALGAELIQTPAGEGMAGAISRAEEFCIENPDTFMPRQFENPANPQIHRETTAMEIWKDTDGRIDILVAGVGTGGTITGVGETLKKLKPEIQVIAVEPAESAVLSGGQKGPHQIQGIGAGFIPSVLNTEIYDLLIQVKSADAIHMQKRLALEEGIFAGISSGAVAVAGIETARKEENRDKLIVAIFPDSGERYLSAL